MRRPLAFLVPLLLLAPTAQARQVRAIQPLTLIAGQPVRVTGMDLEFTGQMLAEMVESDAKAARKRAEDGLPALDPTSYPAGPPDGEVTATTTPSLVMMGEPNDLSRITLRPFGPKVTRTAFAKMLTPLSILLRASSPKRTSFAAILKIPLNTLKLN